jgi:hypothetical protein
MDNLDALVEALERHNPSRDTDRKAEFEASMRYRRALDSWYASMFSAARRGKDFTRERPEPQDFEPRHY